MTDEDRTGALGEWWSALDDQQRAEYAALARGAALSPEQVASFTRADVLLEGGRWIDRPDHVFTMPEDVAEFIRNANSPDEISGDVGGEPVCLDESDDHDPR